MGELNKEERKEFLDSIKQDISKILKNELIENTRKDVLKLIEENFYESVEHKVILSKTEKLLKSYKSLKEHIDNVTITKAEIKDAEKSQLRQMMKNLFTDEELYFEKLYKSRANTEIIVKFLENIFKAYKEEGTGSTYISDIRKRTLLEKMYIQGIPSQTVMLDYTSQKTFYKDKQELIEELAPRIYGVEGLKL